MYSLLEKLGYGFSISARSQIGFIWTKDNPGHFLGLTGASFENISNKFVVHKGHQASDEKSTEK